MIARLPVSIVLMSAKINSKQSLVVSINGIEPILSLLITSGGIINLGIKLLMCPNLKLAKCWYQMDNSLNSSKMVAIKMRIIGIKKEFVG